MPEKPTGEAEWEHTGAPESDRDGEPQVNEPKEETHEISRQAAKITLARVRKLGELNAPTKEEGEQLFAEKTRALWKDLTTHGVIRTEKESGKEYLAQQSDLDGVCCLGLLELAKIDTSEVHYVQAGEYEEKRINLDTGGRVGLVVEDEGMTAFFDHHGREEQINSATEVVYKVLVELGLLKKTDYLDRLTDFVGKVDSASYPDEEAYFEDSGRCILGLCREMDFNSLLEYFKTGRSPTEFLFDSDLKQFGIEQRVSDAVERKVELSLKRLRAMEKNGLIVPSEHYGRIAVVYKPGGKSLPLGFTAAKAYGCDSYVAYDREGNRFFITSKYPLDIELSQGKKIRGKMWNKPSRDPEPLRVSLAEILNLMTDNKLQPSGQLAEFLEDEARAQQ